MPFARTFALSLAALLLAGCFANKEPLVDARTADHPLPVRARYEALKRDGGKWVHDEYVEVALLKSGPKAGWYRMREPRGKSTDEARFALSRIDATRFLAEADVEKDGYWYGLLVSDHGAWLQYGLDELCREFTPEETARFGIKSKSQGTCDVTSLDGLKRFIVEAAGTLPEPDRKYVRR